MKPNLTTLKAYLDALPNVAAKADFAKRCGTTWNYLRLVPYGLKTAGESLAINIERESAGKIRVEDLRPDVDWAVVRRAA
jgi:DNA-binding transcriptional regulator YdaS (Cro superfamily)